MTVSTVDGGGARPAGEREKEKPASWVGSKSSGCVCENVGEVLTTWLIPKFKLDSGLVHEVFCGDTMDWLLGTMKSDAWLKGTAG